MTRRAFMLLACALLLAACGRKGPPESPPDAVPDAEALDKDRRRRGRL